MRAERVVGAETDIIAIPERCQSRRWLIRAASG
jgi:hypothetical protein